MGAFPSVSVFSVTSGPPQRFESNFFHNPLIVKNQTAEAVAPNIFAGPPERCEFFLALV